MPNGLAYLALLAWPPVTIALFRILSVERAVIWSILGGYLLLPPIAAFDFPLIPPLDKFSIATLSAYAACVVILGDRVPLLPTSMIGRALMLLFVISPVMTVLTNPDPIYFTLTAIPGLRIHDSIAAVATQAIAILPFIVIALTLSIGTLIGPSRLPSTRRTIGVVVSGAFVVLVLVNYAWFWPIWTNGLLTSSEWLDRIWFSRWV